MTVNVSDAERYVTPDGRLTYEGLALFQQINTDMGGVGSVAWADITGKPATFPPTVPIAQANVTNLTTDLAGKAAASHNHVAADITDLATVVQAYTLDLFANPVASLDFAQQQTLQFVIENRTSDPGSPVTGEIWLRVDL